MARSLRHLTKKRLTPGETLKIIGRFQKMDDQECAIVLGAIALVFFFADPTLGAQMVDLDRRVISSGFVDAYQSLSKDDAVGYAHASEVSEAAIARAADAIRAVKGGHSGRYAEAPGRTNARLYGDENPLYCDDAYGKNTVWGAQIASPLFVITMGIVVVAFFAANATGPGSRTSPTPAW